MDRKEAGGKREGKRRGRKREKDEEKGASGCMRASHIKSSVRDFLPDGMDRCLFSFCLNG